MVEQHGGTRLIEAWLRTAFGRDWFAPSNEVLPILHRKLGHERTRGDAALNAMLAARHGDIDLAMEFLREEYLPGGFGALVFLWHPPLQQVRRSAKFKTFMIELGLAELWRKTGKWGDFAEPLGENDFRCH